LRDRTLGRAGRKFRLTIHQHRKRVVRVRVYLDGKLIETVRGHRVTHVRVKRLPQALFRLKIVAVTSNGRRVTRVRTYRGCTKSAPHTSIKR
jgi:hypothetical protein